MTDILIHVPKFKLIEQKESFSSLECDEPVSRRELRVVGRTHTLLFHKVTDALMLVTWAKPIRKIRHPRIIEAYSRKMGREIVQNRRDKVMGYLSTSTSIVPNLPMDKHQLHTLIPAVVVDSFEYYVPKAAWHLRMLTCYDIVVYCPVKKKESELILVKGDQFDEVDQRPEEDKENDQTT